MWDQMKQLKDLAGLMSQGSEIREKLLAMKQSLANRVVEAEAGAGAVRVTVDGTLQVRTVILDPVMIQALGGDNETENREMIQTLIVAATNDALSRAQHMIQEHMQQITGSLNLPGLDQLMGP